MATTLDQIVATVRQRVEESKQLLPLRELAERVDGLDRPLRGFRKALLAASEQGIAVIAELKKASPSRGVLRGSYPVGILANQYLQGGAAALSVLTEEKYFQGSLQHLVEASAATDLPCLRKDFTVDEYQLYEARLYCADAVLLIAAVLPDPLYGTLYQKACELGLDVVCEAHNEEELARTVAIGADIIGVNSRDLKTFAIDLQTHVKLAPHLPTSALKVAESGITCGRDVRGLRGLGYQAFLVGESLMKTDDPGAALAQIIGDAKAPPLGAIGVPAWTTGTKD